MDFAKTLGAMSAAPSWQELDMRDGSVWAQHSGLTKREAFAMAAMQGCTTRGGPPGDIAMYAVGCADALLAELAKEQA